MSIKEWAQSRRIVPKKSPGLIDHAFNLIAASLGLPKEILMMSFLSTLKRFSRSFKNVYRGRRRRQLLKARRMAPKASRIEVCAAGVIVNNNVPMQIVTRCFDEVINKGGE